MAPVFAQLEPKKVRDASVFLGLAQGEAFPCVLGVDWLGCAKPRSDTSTGRLEKNQRQQQGMRLEGLHVPVHRSVPEVGVGSIPGAVHVLPAEWFWFSCSVLSFQVPFSTQLSPGGP